MHKTPLRQNVKNSDRKWWVVDASQYTVGQLSVVIADTLRGKNRVDYTPHVDGGDYIVVLNADKVKVTGKKETDKKYYRHSGFLGNLKVRSLAEMREKNPVKILEKAVGGMLPKNRLRAPQLKRLLLVIGNENPHAAQKPETLNVPTS